VAAAGVAGCETLPGAGTPPAAMAPLSHDAHSYARPNEARVTHVALDLRADFERRVLTGVAVLDVTARPDAGEIVLDTRDLTIRSVRTNAGPAEWRLGEADPHLGRPLHVEIGPRTRQVTVEYETSPDAAALQWLTPGQ